MEISPEIQVHMIKVIENLAMQGFLYKNLPQYQDEMTKSYEHYWAGIIAMDMIERDSDPFRTISTYHIESYYKGKCQLYRAMYRKVVKDGKNDKNF